METENQAITSEKEKKKKQMSNTQKMILTG